MIVSEEVVRTLEVPETVGILAARCRSDLGRNELRALKPFSDLEGLLKRQELLTSYRDYTSAHGDFPWALGVVPLTEALDEAKSSGMMSSDELLCLRKSLQLASDVRDYARVAREKYGSLSFFVSKIREFDAEIQALKIINEDGTLSNLASPLLREIRESLSGTKAQIRSAGNAFLGSSKASMLQERVLTLRNGRFSVLVKQPFVNRFPGVITDRSSSGSSTYMEPNSILPLNNKMIKLIQEESDEVRRILRELTKQVLGRYQAILDAEEALGVLDMFYALNEVMGVDRWRLPEMVKRPEFTLYRVKHPLLGSKAVPIDIRVGKDFKALVVTGPNTGGKTVALKTAALAVYLSWCGLPIPADEGSSVGNISAIYADIGDEQSIEQNLSTFSSHLVRIVGMLDNADELSLVLLDELGAGTDPQEGSALGIALLEEFLRRKSLVLATTHHNPIKRFATTTPGVEAASVEFDMRTLSPTYRLLIGIPGQSNALAIAARYGMPKGIIKRAESCLDSGEIDAERLMGQLQEKRASLDALERELVSKQVELQKEQDEVTAIRSAYERKRDQSILKAEAEATRILDDAEKKAKDLLKTLSGVAESMGHREMGKHKQETEKIRERASVRQKSIEARYSKPVDEFKVGQTVRLSDGKAVGEILSISGKSAEVQVGPMRISVELSKLTPAKAPKVKDSYDTSIIKRPEGVSSSFMIRGMTADEAIPQVESYLDKSMRAGYGEVAIIHGRGEGILRRQVHELCNSLSYVADCRLGDRGEGGWGVTIVRFK